MELGDEAVLLHERLELGACFLVDVHRCHGRVKHVGARQVGGQRLAVQFGLLDAQFACALEVEVGEHLPPDRQRQAPVDVGDGQLFVFWNVATSQDQTEVTDDLIAAVVHAAVVEEGERVEQSGVVSGLRDLQEMLDGLKIRLHSVGLKL